MANTHPILCWSCCEEKPINVPIYYIERPIPDTRPDLAWREIAWVRHDDGTIDSEIFCVECAFPKPEPIDFHEDIFNER